ncbi:Gfo/Idh/MocA family protein [Planctomyces sp. SH-PL62]|uniref:Gfo/Idh/MocA family protein n=1 Tax=Planctomyces sp. SH-PL62 TaxID=1636152 RepID=UPI00078C7E8B|nr:Gfo/Idh/MocA family oxidoreductase [Planctomyces sp. SH-PL62]AMV37489.1 1,5-anhydro-D-fructose reductase [Planctomyces sp. SH-PL62]
MGLRWGLLGCARICRRGLIPGIRASELGTLAALASRDGDQAKAWAAEFAIPRAYGSYEELIADPEIDAVYIPLPNELHKPWTLKAADAGKHVLCEKPLALDAGEAREMAEHCRARGVLLMEAFMWRHQPRTHAIRKLVDDGTIGDLRLVRCSFSFPIDPNDWRLDPERGGGPIWDIGTYGVNMARLFAKEEPTRIQAVGRLAASGVEMSVAAVLQFPNDVLAAVDCSFEQPFRCVYELVGTRGVIEVPDAFLPPASGPTAILRKTAAPSDVGAAGDRIETLTFPAVDQYAAMVDSFDRSVAAGTLEDPAQDGQAQMRVLDEICRAVQTG